MCGIVGMADYSKAGIGLSELEIFENLLIVDMIRGFDGTGVIAVDEDGINHQIRISSHTMNLFGTKEYDKFRDKLKRGYIRFLVGHNRWATRGQRSSQNTHPFVHKHISMVHNGTLESYSELPNFSKFDVDSMALCHGIAELGIDEAIKKTAGAYAIVYYDKKQKTLNLLRNWERPLFIGYNFAKDFYMWASEKEMLDLMLARHKFLPNMTIKALEPHMLLTLDLDNGKEVFRKIEPRTVYSTFNKRNYGPANTDVVEVFTEEPPLTEIERARRSASNLTAPATTKPPAIIKGKDKKTYIQREELFGYKKGVEISFSILNWTTAARNQVEIEGGKDDFLTVEVKARLEDNPKFEELVACQMVKGKIINIMESTRKDMYPSVFWVKDVEPYNTKLAIVKH